MLSLGIYEQVINQIIKQHLGQLENELVKIVTDPIDSAESSKILAEYFGLLLRRVLDYIEGENEAVENRISLCNRLIDYIAEAMDNGFSRAFADYHQTPCSRSRATVEQREKRINVA